MADTVLSVRVDSGVKASFSALCEELGLSASAAVNMFMRQMLREQSLPFKPTLQPCSEAKKTLSHSAISKAVSLVASKRPSIKSISLFGSYARGEATEESDVDLRVVLDPGCDLGLIGMSSFASELKGILGKPVDIVSAAELNEDMENAIAHEGVVIYERS